MKLEWDELLEGFLLGEDVVAVGTDVDSLVAVVDTEGEQAAAEGQQQEHHTAGH